MAENTQDKRNRKVIIDFVNSTIGNINNKDITLVKHPCIAEAELLEGLCGAIVNSMVKKDQKYSYVSKIIDTTFTYIRNSTDKLLEKSKTASITSMYRSVTIKVHSSKKDNPYIIDIFYILDGYADKNCNIYYSAMDSNEDISNYISNIDYISVDAGFILSNNEDESKLIIIDDKSSEIFIDIRDNTESVSAFISNVFNYVIDIYLDILQEIVDIEEGNVEDNYDAITDNDNIEEVIEEDQEESDYESNNTGNKFKVFTREMYLPSKDIIIPDPNFVNETYKFYNDINVEDMLGLENTIPGISKALISMDKNNKVNLYNAGVTLLEFIFSENKNKYIHNKEQMGYNDVIVSLAYDNYCIFIIIDTKNKKLYLHTNITERVFNKLLSLDLNITDIQINIGYRIMKDGQASYEKCVMRFSDKFNSRSLNHETCCIKNIFNRETIFDIFLKCIGEAMINVANIKDISSTNSNYGLEPYIIYDHNFNTILKTIEDSGVFDNLSKDMYGALKFILNDKTDNDYLKYLKNRKFVEKDESLHHTISSNGDNIMIMFINKINIIDSCGNIQTAENTQGIAFGNFTIIKSNKMVTLSESTYTKSGQVTKDMLKIVKYMEYVNNNAEGQ